MLIVCKYLLFFSLFSDFQLLHIHNFLLCPIVDAPLNFAPIITWQHQQITSCACKKIPSFVATPHFQGPYCALPPKYSNSTKLWRWRLLLVHFIIEIETSLGTFSWIWQVRVLQCRYFTIEFFDWSWKYIWSREVSNTHVLLSLSSVSIAPRNFGHYHYQKIPHSSLAVCTGCNLVRY